MGRHPWPAIERRLQILLVDAAHQLQVERRFCRRRVVVAGPGQTHQLALAPNADVRVVRLNHGPFGLNGKGRSFFSATPTPS